MAVYKACSWRLASGAGSETATLSREASGWVFHGHITRTVAEARIEAEYVVICDPRWNTLTAKVVVSDGRRNWTLDLANENGFWFKNGKRYPAVDGCTDVDLEWSPATNTLPIRRINIPVGGESGLVTAAWIRFPELAVQVLPQTYRRIAEDSYMYRSHGDAFQALITVDQDHLVIDYEGLWNREPMSI